MKILDTLLARIAPYDCLLCGHEGAVICGSCVTELGPRIPSRCINCQKLTADFRICETCRSTISLEHVWVAFVYSRYAKEIIKEFKFNGKRAVAKELAHHMSSSGTKNNNTILVHIPTATARIRERGYDHAKLLAAALAKESGLIHLPLLARTSQQRQVGSGRTERFKNISGVFRISGTAKDVEGAHILLVDDVVTTGATLAEAARVLRAAGAQRVDATVFAQTVL